MKGGSLMNVTVQPMTQSIVATADFNEEEWREQNEGRWVLLSQQEIYDFLLRQPLDENGYLRPLGELEDFNDFLLKLAKAEILTRPDAHLLETKGVVPSDIWCIVNECGELVGIAKLRYHLTPRLLRHGGNVGIGIAKLYQGEGYGTAAMREIIQIMRAHGCQDLILTAQSANEASCRMIRKLGGMPMPYAYVPGEESSMTGISRFILCV